MLVWQRGTYLSNIWCKTLRKNKEIKKEGKKVGKKKEERNNVEEEEVSQKECTKSDSRSTCRSLLLAVGVTSLHI
jgi:hypothetical protein